MEKQKCYDKLFGVYRMVYSSRYLEKTLRGVSIAAVAVSALTYAACIYAAWQISAVRCVIFAMSTAIPFLLVSVVRRVINAPRPYEVFDMSELTASAPHEKLGASFPSRHVFSAFVIGVAALSHVPVIAILTLVLGVLLGASRVLLGIHFVRDVICGATIGIVSGLVYLLVL